MAEKVTSQVNSGDPELEHKADDQALRAHSGDSNQEHVADNDQTSKIISGDAGQNHTENDNHKLTYIHDLIEILVGSVAIIAPTILLFLWVYRFMVCQFYGLPTFYSSLNIVRALPAFVFFAISLVYILLEKILILHNGFSVEILYRKHENKKKFNQDTEQKRTSEIDFRDDLAQILKLIFFAPLPLVLFFEVDGVVEGMYPYILKNGHSVEAVVVLTYAIFALTILLRQLCEGKKLGEITKLYSSGKDFYASRRLKNLVVHISHQKKTTIATNLLKGLFVVYLTSSIALAIGLFALVKSYGQKSYYLVDFNNRQYAIVLDTDDYYIGEPIEISQNNNGKTLKIQTDSYIYLDKAENPLEVRKESFDSVDIIKK